MVLVVANEGINLWLKWFCHNPIIYRKTRETALNLKYINRIATVLLLIPGLLFMAAVQSADSGSAGMKTISGTIWYRERMMLPADAKIHVILEDVSRMDVASTVIAETDFKPEGGPPYAFSLRYDPARIKPNMHYAMRVRIDADGQLMFINTERMTQALIRYFSGS